jgi:hypothetical protein
VWWFNPQLAPIALKIIKSHCLRRSMAMAPPQPLPSIPLQSQTLILNLIGKKQATFCIVGFVGF